MIQILTKIYMKMLRSYSTVNQVYYKDDEVPIRDIQNSILIALFPTGAQKTNIKELEKYAGFTNEFDIEFLEGAKTIDKRKG